jgi:hypothetical protein
VNKIVVDAAQPAVGQSSGLANGWIADVVDGVASAERRSLRRTIGVEL